MLDGTKIWIVGSFLAYVELPSPKGMNILTSIVEEINILQIKDLLVITHSLNNLLFKNSYVLVSLVNLYI